MGCTIAWISKLQSQIASSTTQAKYIALSMAMREVIPIKNLLNELKDKEYNTTKSSTKTHCKIFEDNSAALKMASTPKMRPRKAHKHYLTLGLRSQ